MLVLEKSTFVSVGIDHVGKAHTYLSKKGCKLRLGRIMGGCNNMSKRDGDVLMNCIQTFLKFKGF